jgi:hypothetical protein
MCSVSGRVNSSKVHETSERPRPTSDHSEDELLAIKTLGVFRLETAGFRVRVAFPRGAGLVAKSKDDGQTDDGQTQKTVEGSHDRGNSV